MRFLTPFLFSIWTLIPLGHAADGNWLDSYEAGLKKAQKEEKDLLISFMGSDWCDQCKVLKEAVLTKDEFVSVVEENFVLVELDFPQTQPKIAERNEPIRVQYGVHGYPILLATDSSGHPYGEVRYFRDWKTAQYLKAIELLDGNKAKRDEAQGEFEHATDDASRAAALEKMLRAVPETSIAKMYSEEFANLRKYSKDKSPLVAGIVKKEGIENLQNDLQTLMGQRKYQEAVELCKEYLAQENLDSHQLQAGLTLKYFSLMKTQGFAEAVETAKALNEVDPESPIGQQAVGMARRAQAALNAADKPKPVKPVQPKKEGPMIGEKKDGAPEIAKTDQVAPLEKGATTAKHQKALLVLEETHKALAAAEEALAKAEADLAAAREKHLKAHQDEANARKMAEKKAAMDKEKKQQEAPEKESPVETPASTPQIDEFEKRAADLRKQAEDLRKKAQELREATED